MPESASGPITVGIVPHTHWDREWYAPFQVFRSRLVTLLDELIPLLEQDLSYARFLLDGQTAVVDDYLEIRPEAETRLQRLGASGRLQMGPWMILMDEYMVSGETIVRDLQFGIERAARFGGAMPVGYLPDMFGHVAQMPQILTLAGLDQAVVWRGVPSTVDRTAFWWEAPDGSRVRAEYLYGSYSNGRDLPDDAKQLVQRARAYDDELGPARLPGGGMLLMNGTDHQMPQPWLGRVVAEANDIQDDYRFVVTSLPEYLAEQPEADLGVVTGEMRSGARANVLMGVASNRVDTHQRCARAERTIERRAEPLATLFQPADAYPHALLREAWRLLILNSAHDSSCACSHDEVVDAVNVRYDEARQIGTATAKLSMKALAATIDAPIGSTIVANSTQADRPGVVELLVAGNDIRAARTADGGVAPIQVLETLEGEAFSATVDAPDSWAFDLVRGPEFAGQQIARVERSTTADGAVELHFHVAGADERPVDLTDLREEIGAIVARGTPVRLALQPVPAGRLLVGLPRVPGFGWTTVTFDTVAPGPLAGTARIDGEGRLTNGLVHVTVDPATGTLTVTSDDGVEVAGAHRLVDGGDGGDTYNYSPPDADGIVDTPTSVDVTIIEPGPVRARARIVATYEWPTHAIGDGRACSARSAEAATAKVTTTVDVHAHEPFVRLRVDLDNPARDHRLRTHVPLPRRVSGSHAECAFSVVERGLTTEGGPHEQALPTWVSRRFVDASDGDAGVALLHDGLLEYEIVDAPDGHGQELALTLLRATGWLSRSGIAYRPNPAGPQNEVRGAQMPGAQTLEYAIVPHRGDWRDAELPALADAFLVPFPVTAGAPLPDATRPPEGRGLSVTGATVSAYRRDDGGRILRLVNLSGVPTRATVDDATGPAAGWTVDLLGRPGATVDGGVDLGPWEIVTLRLRER